MKLERKNSMGLLNKIKDMFYEEDEFEDIPRETKKEEKKYKEEEEIKEEPKKDTASVISERDLFKTDPKFKFPINFDDEDLVEEDTTKKINALKEEENKYRVVETKTVIENTKTFRPSPVISPIYGILDKNYKKGDIVEKGSASGFDIDGKLDVDSVMKKAYGEVEFKKTITREEKSYITVEEPVEKDAEINLFEALKEDPKEDKTLSRIEQNESEYEEESYDLDEIDDKIKSIDQLLKETSDDDFYSLVDKMYKDEGGEE
jgi:hypothetical protein